MTLPCKFSINLRYLSYFSDYVNDIYKNLLETPRPELKIILSELEAEVPEPMHMMHEKEDSEESIKKYRERKEKETPQCPPTCTGKYVKINNYQFNIVKNKINVSF